MHRTFDCSWPKDEVCAQLSVSWVIRMIESCMMFRTNQVVGMKGCRIVQGMNESFGM